VYNFTYFVAMYSFVKKFCIRVRLGIVSVQVMVSFVNRRPANKPPTAIGPHLLHYLKLSAIVRIMPSLTLQILLISNRSCGKIKNGWTHGFKDIL